ncbi:MAG: hypothetical protein AABY46_04470 [Nitrospirota bacterium]
MNASILAMDGQRVRFSPDGSPCQRHEDSYDDRARHDLTKVLRTHVFPRIKVPGEDGCCGCVLDSLLTAMAVVNAKHVTHLN